MELHAITVCPGDYPLLQKHFHDFNDFVSEAKAKSWKTLVHCQVEWGPCGRSL